LRTVVAEKLASAQEQVIELITLTAELQQAAAALDRHRPAGACDDRCGCVSDAPVGPGPAIGDVALAAGPRPMDTETLACTLDAGALPGRVEDWQAVLAHVSRREQIDDGLRLVFGSTVPVDELMRLTAAEQSCCQFFAFAITVDARGIALEGAAPAEALPIVWSMFGAAT
jgi:hypothetical protein